MDLNYVYTELQRLTTLVEGWKTAAEVNALERDLVLARLRDLYEAVRFEGSVAPAAAEQNASLVPPMPLPESEPLPDEEFEPLDADDFLSLDSLIQEENIPEEPQTEAPAEEEAEEEAEEDDEENTEPEVEVELIFADEEEADDEDLLAGLLPDQEEEMADVAEEEEMAEEPAEEEEVLPIVEEQQPEVEETPEVAEEPAAESEPETTEPEPEPQSEPEPQKPVLSLFGDDEAAKPRYTHRQRVIMSLYDAPEYDEPESRGPVKQVVPSSTQLTEVEAEPELVAVLGEDAEVIYERPTHQPEVELEVETPAEEPLVEEELESEEVVPETPKTVEPAPQPQPAPTPKPQPQPAPQPQPEAEQPKTLGESVQPRPTLADQLAARQQSSLHRPVTDLRRAVSLNDKLLMIRELFNGNGALYEITIRKLNDFTTFEDCLIYIAEHFDWNPNSDGAKLMVDLLERKFKQ